MSDLIKDLETQVLLTKTIVGRLNLSFDEKKLLMKSIHSRQFHLLPFHLSESDSERINNRLGSLYTTYYSALNRGTMIFAERGKADPEYNGTFINRIFSELLED